MSRIAPALMASAAKGLTQGQPGSNGYWRRDQFLRPGTYTWTATKAGKIKIQALGAAAGANGARPGASAGFGEKTLSVSVGDVLTLVLGEGGLAFNGNSNTVRSSAGGSTSISGSPVGGTPLVLTGAIGSTEDTTLPGTAGGGSGPWDVIFSGVVAAGTGRGSPSSGSPFGPGIAPDGYGGAGWIGTTSTVHGGGSKTSANDQSGGSGMTTFATVVASGNTTFRQGSAERARPFWDLRDVDSAGGTSLKDASGNVTYAEDAGPGAGGSGSQTGTGGVSALGGGSGFAAGFPRGLAGFGAGGAGSNNPTNNPLNGSGSKGGNAFVQIFWDEVA